MLRREVPVGWLIAIVCIILVILFWRYFLPLALLAAIGLGALLLYSWNENKRDEQNRADAEQSLTYRFAAAESTANAVKRTWEVDREVDPSSGRETPRSATITSDNGLCRLQVEERIDRTRLTGIYCPGFNQSAYNDIQVKFDNRETSDPMRLELFSDYRDAYITSRQYSNDLDYDEFLRRLTSAAKVALRLNFDIVGQKWITFSLAGSDSALAQIGAVPARNLR
jgi:hypothetical protein